MRIFTGNPIRALAVVALVASVGAGCGDDGDDAADPPETSADTESPTTPPDDGTDVDLATFCEAAIGGEAVFLAGPALDAQGNPTPDGLEQFESDIEPFLADLEEHAPAEVAGAVETVVAGVRSAIEGGDASATESPEFFEADSTVDAYVYDRCDLDATEEIVAVNYAFDEVPETVAAGQVGIRLDNQGTEVHEAVLLRIDDDADESVEDLLALPEEEAMELTEFAGVAFAGPGEQGYAVADLDPGRYALVCFIPVGTTSLDGAPGPDGEGAVEAPPHFTEGMATEFLVE